MDTIIEKLNSIAASAEMLSRQYSLGTDKINEKLDTVSASSEREVQQPVAVDIQEKLDSISRSLDKITSALDSISRSLDKITSAPLLADHIYTKEDLYSFFNGIVEKGKGFISRASRAYTFILINIILFYYLQYRRGPLEQLEHGV
jgi:hypothetical protein